jgi:UDP-3-O-acyl-N-acetylglucosamine deacetylase
MTVHPGDNGIGFRIGSERVAADPRNVTDTTRSTKLGPIGTVEHLMSAFCGLEITDAEVELDAPELPGMDGSAGPYVDVLVEAGFETLPSREVPDLFRRLFFQDGDVKIAIGGGQGGWRYLFQTGERWPSEQIFHRDDVVGSYVLEIAPSRTFAFAEEIPAVIQAGLGKGLDVSSVLVLGMEGYKNEARFEDEPARHKLLDAMGDLYLTGVPARHLSVVAERSGHKAHVAAAKMLAESLS